MWDFMPWPGAIGGVAGPGRGRALVAGPGIVKRLLVAEPLLVFLHQLFLRHGQLHMGNNGRNIAEKRPVRVGLNKIERQLVQLVRCVLGALTHPVAGIPVIDLVTG